jgi:hypothetical protein
MKRSTPSRAATLAVLVLAARLAAGADAPEDPPADVTLDITRAAGSPTAVVVSSQSQLWQLGHDAARPGCGVGFLVCKSPAVNGCDGRVFIDVEALGDRKVQDALDDLAKKIPDEVKAEGCELVGQPSIQGKPEQIAVGKAKYKGYRLKYEMVPSANRTAGSVTVVGVVLEVGKSLVEVQTERYTSKSGYLDLALSSMTIGPVPAKRTAPAQLKFVDCTGGTQRYVDAKVPVRWTFDPADDMGTDFEHWCRRDPKSGQVVSRVTLFGQLVGKDFDLAKHAGDRRVNWQADYKEVSEPTQVNVGSSVGYAITCDNPAGPGGKPSKLRKVVTRLGDMSVVWTLETTATEDKEVAADNAAFEEMLASVKTWVGSV